MAGTGRDNSYPTAKLSTTYSVSFNIFLLFIKLYNVTIIMMMNGDGEDDYDNGVDVVLLKLIMAASTKSK